MFMCGDKNLVPYGGVVETEFKVVAFCHDVVVEHCNTKCRFAKKKIKLWYTNHLI